LCQGAFCRKHEGPLQSDGTHAKLDTQAIAAELEKATLNPGAVAQTIGDTDKSMASAVTKVEGDLPGSVPRARDDGADELHRPCPQGQL
jgi:hypothetical protein